MCISKAGCRRQDAGVRSGRQSGISLIELIMFIVIVSVALTGLLLVMNVANRGGVDPLLHKQALAVAESLLEEIELQNFTEPVGGYTGTDRSQFDSIMDYNGYATSGIYHLDGTTPVTGLENYSVSVTVAGAALGTIDAASAALITVTVTEPDGASVDAVGYRANY